MCLAPARLPQEDAAARALPGGLGLPGAARAGSRGSVVGTWRGVSVGAGAGTRGWRGRAASGKGLARLRPPGRAWSLRYLAVQRMLSV